MNYDLPAAAKLNKENVLEVIFSLCFLDFARVTLKNFSLFKLTIHLVLNTLDSGIIIDEC